MRVDWSCKPVSESSECGLEEAGDNLDDLAFSEHGPFNRFVRSALSARERPFAVYVNDKIVDMP